jgi:hypothetical protein
MVLPAARNGLQLAGNATNPDKFQDESAKYEHIKDLAAMRHYEGWQHDCTKMLDFV